ncbi:MAG: hypothetical protein AB1758_13315 [Candidatus Eremiobacterota bacterium]
MDSLLEDLHSQGLFDSSGSFTLDLGAAREKLRAFQLPDRCFYVLKWIQSAVASGATMVTLACDARRVVFLHDGRPPDPAGLRDLLGCLLSSTPGDPALGELAAGANAALGFPGARLTIQAASEAGGARLHLTSDAAEFRPAAPSARPKTWLVLERPLGWRHAFRRAPEVVVLHERACLAPLRITCNAQTLEPRFGHPVRLRPFSFYGPWQVTNLGGRIVARNHHVVEIRHPVDKAGALAPGPCSATRPLDDGPTGALVGEPPRYCSWAVGLRADRTWPRLRVFRRGVLLESWAWGHVPGTEAVLSADDLDVDVSGFAIGRRPALERRMSMLGHVAGKLENWLGVNYPAPTLAVSMAHCVGPDPLLP